MNILKKFIAKIFKKPEEEQKIETILTTSDIENANQNKPKKNIKYILCLDGGGTRGVVEIEVMRKIEEIAFQLSGSEKKIPECFDIISGTSVGGIFALILANDKNIGSDKLSNFFMANFKNIFSEPKKSAVSFFNISKIVDNKYSDEGREKTFVKFVGDTKFSELKINSMCLAYNMNEKRMQVFSPLTTPDCTIFDALMATSAAPTYFSCHKVRLNGNECTYTDGGVGANNPSFFAYKYAKEYFANENVDEYRLLSISAYKNPISLSSVNNKKDWIDLNKYGFMPIQKIYSLTQDELIDESCKNINNLKYLRIKNDNNEFKDYFHTDATGITDIEKLKDIGKKIANKYEDELKEFMKYKFCDVY